MLNDFSVPRTGTATIAVALLLLGGCAAAPTTSDLLTTPLRVRTIDGAPPLRDGRSAFRETFCSTMQADGRTSSDDVDCERWLWRLADEPQVAGVQSNVPVLSKPATIVLVTGAFSECTGEAARPFSAGAARLLAGGTNVRTLVVGGRSGTEHNARQIAEALKDLPLEDDEALVLIGYSKGAIDILQFLVDFPSEASRVDAMVSVAGPVFGTPLAAKADSTYRVLFGKLPYPNCPPGDGKVLASLAPDTRTHWLETIELPTHVRYYSMAAFTTREHIARGLESTWKMLAQSDPRNDGQVIAADAVIPGSTLLAYVNSDHWGAAMTFESEHKILGARPDPTTFPLEQLFRAIVQFIEIDFNKDRP